jgi:hypothetical protein
LAARRKLVKIWTQKFDLRNESESACILHAGNQLSDTTSIGFEMNR